ncbi:MAG: tetratricopeptide repeat protein [Proteobacteria bacterium]|nr:tetratricopeptide repeat protein [Pseudomonadota bacterium]
MPRHFSTAEVARLLGVSDDWVRATARSGLCHPQRRGRRYAFSFQDLVVLYAARDLVRQRVPTARVRRALRSLAETLPPNRPLSGLRVRADGRSVTVRDGGGAWEPETGQRVLDFQVDAVAELVADLERRDEPGQGGAQAAFRRGLELEDDDPKAARAAYAHAVELDPGLVDALVNLGRLAHDAGDAAEAARLYHHALERTPDDAVIHFNLALALEDARGPAAAVAHYERALALDADFADAHYNLAGLCEQLGRGADAIRHYHAYKRLTSDEPDE